MNVCLFSEVPEVSEASLQCKAISWTIPSPSAQQDILADSTRHGTPQDQAWDGGTWTTEGR